MHYPLPFKLASLTSPLSQLTLSNYAASILLPLSSPQGYDQFMNLVLDRAVEEVSTSVKHDIGQIVIRGSGIVQLEALEAL